MMDNVQSCDSYKYFCLEVINMGTMQDMMHLIFFHPPMIQCGKRKVVPVLN
jgi:hypothetical protein